ncbi:MAG: hypothetical protein ACI30K_08595 [Muribaculaceae bacterium]
MKRLALLLLLCTSLLCNAQFYDPYQQAFEYGQQLARQQQQANQQAFDRGYAMGLVMKGQQLIAQGQYEEGYDSFWEAWNVYQYAPALECLGICYEVGLGTDRDLEWADLHYEEGARLNDANCKAAVRRINANGHYPASYKSNIISYLQAKFGGASGYSGNATPNYNSGGYYSTPSNSSSSSSGRTCPSCHGRTTCNTCGGQGSYWEEVGTYTGTSTKKKINCPVCSGSGRCGTCHGQGIIR